MLAIRVNDLEAKQLRELADLDGVSQSDIVRLLVRHAHAERIGDKKRSKK